MRFTFLIATLFLAACVSPQQQAQQRAADKAARQGADRERCIDYGFQEGTQPYAQCRLNIDQQRKARKAAIAGAILSRPAPQPYMMPTNPSITCNTFGNTTTCR